MIGCFVLFVIITTVSSAVVPLAPATNCSETECKLPDCRCMGVDIPGGLAATDIPQIILLTFDDAVTEQDFTNFYMPLLEGRLNPNGCPVQLTFFLTHQYNDYTLVHQLYHMGHEIASHSITHRTNDTWWTSANETEWKQEIVDLRTMTSKYANIPIEAITGSRAPFLLMGGNEMMNALENNGFHWDCSWTTRNLVDPGLWPYTLDYKSWQDCFIGRCPDESFPGFWEVPMIDLTDKDGYPCGMLDTCSRPFNQSEAFDLLKNNFDVHYNGNRSPYGLFLHAGWFQFPHNYAGYRQFLDTIASYNDVFIVTISQLLDWVRNPTTTEGILNGDLPSWNCPTTTPVPTSCDLTRCYYPPELTPMGAERYLSICSFTCPPFYPWYENPDGLYPPKTGH